MSRQVNKLIRGATGTPLPTTAANAGLFTDTTASANTTYAYRVTAVNDVTGTGASSQSNTITTPLSDGQFPYNTGRTTWVTDQTIEAEDFDAGGQGVSYNDSIVR